MKETRYAPCVRLFTLATILIASVGCGGSGDIGYVTGKVQYNGEPVPVDTRVFFDLPGSGYLAAGIAQADGTYTLRYKRSEEIQTGDYILFVGAPASNMSAAEFMKFKAKVNAEYRSRGETPPPSPDWVLPVKYYDPTTSPLRATIEPGDNVIDVILED